MSGTDEHPDRTTAGDGAVGPGAALEAASEAARKTASGGAPLVFEDVGALAEAVRSGRRSALEVVEAHLARAVDLNPRLNALTVVFADRARAEAQRVDRVVADGGDPGPLAGVPFSVKENIDLTWSATTQGWRAAVDAVPAVDAAIVRRARAAGAVPVGRGNMPDIGMRWDTDNDLFGRTANPWHPNRTAGGSSGGDAVAAATGMSAFGLGNDYGGSVRIPAAASGIAGLRPSRGRVPKAAVRQLPVALTLQQFSVNGIVAPRVDDLRRVLAVIEGVDVEDPVSQPVAPPVDRPRRVAVVPDPAGQGTHPAVRAAVDRAAAAMAAAGWQLVDDEPPHLAEAAVLWRRLACTDMLMSLDPAALPMPLGRSATAFLRDSTAAAEPYETAREYAQAWARRAVIAADWRRFQAEVPIVLGPVMTEPVPEPDFDLAGSDSARRDRPGGELGGREAATAAWRMLRLTVAVNFLGLPAATVAAGRDDTGLPVGVQLIGPEGGDLDALAAASDVESALGTLTR